MSIHLRQICLVAEKLAPVTDDLKAVFSLEACYIDPGVATFEIDWDQNEDFEGNKLELAAQVPRVGFQVDTTAETGSFAWHSVMATGSFHLVGEPEEIRIVGHLLGKRFADAPQWWREEQAGFGREGELIFWRLEPDTLSGRAEGP